mmetsp:Transcript_21906/g.42544  ORF Transcript_21906/g.42544 Transcript_21906/m.42544 type:complete len:411 (-) Transcript_21906:95-1327(-)
MSGEHELVVPVKATERTVTQDDVERNDRDPSSPKITQPLSDAPRGKMEIEEKKDEDSIYWTPPELKKPFPFLHYPTIPFPDKLCGRRVPFKLVLVLLFAFSAAVTVVIVASELQFGSMDSTRVKDFLNNANTQYVGDGGLAFFFCLLLVWCSISGYFLLRTGDIDLFGFFHLLGPPGIGMLTQGLFTTDMNAVYWDGPKQTPGMYYTFGISIPLLTLGSGYLVYIAVSRNIQCQVLYDTISWGYFGAIPLTILKFGFAGVLEELGWSAVMFPQLLHATHSYIAASVLGGVVWGIWHVPLVIGGGYNNNINPFWAAFVLPWMTTAWAFFNVWLRVRSWSIWPVVVSHVAHNCWIELLLDPLVGRSEYRGLTKLAREKRAHYFVGEFGMLGALSYMVCAMVFVDELNGGWND